MMKISIGYPLRAAEREILKGGSKRSELYRIDPFMNAEEILKTQEMIKQEIYVSDKILDYILNVIEATRSNQLLFRRSFHPGRSGSHRCRKGPCLFQG